MIDAIAPAKEATDTLDTIPAAQLQRMRTAYRLHLEGNDYEAIEGEMKIGEAIEIKERPPASYPPTSQEKIYQADQLSIEALKWRKSSRTRLTSQWIPLLPGETEDLE